MRRWLAKDAARIDEPSAVLQALADIVGSADIVVVAEHGLWESEMRAVLRWLAVQRCTRGHASHSSRLKRPSLVEDRSNLSSASKNNVQLGI